MSFGRITKLHVNIAKCQTRITYANGASRLLTNNPSGFAFRSMGDTSCHCPVDASTRARYFLHRHFGKRGSIERTASLDELMLALGLDFTADDEAEELRQLEGQQQQRVEQEKQGNKEGEVEELQQLVLQGESSEISQEASEVELLLQDVVQREEEQRSEKTDHRKTSELLILLESQTKYKRESKKSSEHESEHESEHQSEHHSMLDSDKSFEQKSKLLWVMESNPKLEQKTEDLLKLEPEQNFERKSVKNSEQDLEEVLENKLDQALAEHNFVNSEPPFALKSSKSEKILNLETNEVSEDALNQTLEETWKASELKSELILERNSEQLAQHFFLPESVPKTELNLKKAQESTRNPKLKSVKSEQLLILKSEVFLRQKPEPFSEQVSSSKTERESKKLEMSLQMQSKGKIEHQQEQKSVPEPKVECTWYLEELPKTLLQRATMREWPKGNLKLSNCAGHLKHCQARTTKCKCQCISKTVERINELTRASLSEPVVNKDAKQWQKSIMKANLVSLNGLLMQLAELLEQ